MLSSAGNNAAGRCIYCAFRSRRIALQSFRQRSTSSLFTRFLRDDDDNNPRKFRIRRDRGQNDGPLSFRYTGPRDEGGRDDRSTSFRNPGRGTIIKDGRFRGRDREPKADFRDALNARLKAMKEELQNAPVVEHLQKDAEREGDKVDGFGKIWKDFTRKLRPGLNDPWYEMKSGKDEAQDIVVDLKKAYAQRGERGLDDRIKYAFYGHVTGAKFTESDIRNQRALADLRYPTEWYPGTRVMRRTIHLHVGPTNSGKTYHALQRLEQAQNGVYAGPLRLLAHEVYTRMNAKGKCCVLITGEERRAPELEDESSLLTSCTVEMMPLNRTLDVAVIDEIQMIGNSDRGWAWTQAVLGAKAKEVHLCGEERTIPIIKELTASLGEELVIHRYQRLSPLKVAEESLNGKLSDLRKGDCIVSFSVMGIHALRRQIEKATGKKVAIVYGSLPPETRAQQARLFNEPDNDYDYLVASDAVGMGLNLAIKRLIFETSTKFDGIERRTLSVADIKQIGGRAGRYRTAAQATDQPAATQDIAAAKGELTPVTPAATEDTETVGIVTTLEKFDFPVVRAAMEAEPEPILTAGIFPPSTILERFSSYFPPGTPFSYILTRLHELSLMHKRFHLCGLKDQVWIADLIEPVPGLSIEARNIICASPASKTDIDLWRDLLPAYARVIAEQSGGNLLDIPEVPLETLDAKVSASREYLRELERLHKGLVSYLWLSYRFAGIFTTRALAFHAKGLVEEKIEDVLGKFSFSEAQRRKIAQKREESLMRGLDMAGTDESGNPLLDAETGEDVRVAPEVEELDDSLATADPAEVEEQDRNSVLEQTQSTTGGGRFSGEDDIQFDEPGQLDAEFDAPSPDAQPSTTSFAAWRAGQVRGESQGTHEEEDEDATSLGAAAVRGEEAGRAAAQELELEDKRSSEGHQSGDAANFAQVTPEFDLSSSQPPLEAQEVPPSPENVDERVSDRAGG